ncbi:hypothetical protein BIY22_13215 [Vibrio panuliri]|uniref:Uncharacterized protein n=1 Tax=Vibrio panuliri TaxID=1381081 RepID=A0A1Q9H9U2_9VIBR|nr:hypothetical protein BIY22_13215 [Vibrio panuliri]
MRPPKSRRDRGVTTTIPSANKRPPSLKEREFDYVGLVEADNAYTYRKGLKPNEMTISKPEATTPQTGRIVSLRKRLCNCNNTNFKLIYFATNYEWTIGKTLLVNKWSKRKVIWVIHEITA